MILAMTVMPGRSASIGFIFAALFAGYRPNTTPTSTQKAAASSTAPGLTEMTMSSGHSIIGGSSHLCHNSVKSVKTILFSDIPPVKQDFDRISGILLK